LIHDCRGEDPVALEVDQYPAHVSESSLAQSLNIRVILVAKGGTSFYSPLDRKISRNMKAKVREMFGKMMLAEVNQLLMKDSTAELTEACWNEIAPDNVLDAWEMEDLLTELNPAGSLADDEFPAQGDSLGDDDQFRDREFGHDDLDDVMALERQVLCLGEEAEDADVSKEIEPPSNLRCS
jgi:hypothetical protein